jgi:hypothetical protein
MIRSLIFNNHNLQAPSNNYDSRGAHSVLTNVVIKVLLLKVTFNFLKKLDGLIEILVRFWKHCFESLKTSVLKTSQQIKNPFKFKIGIGSICFHWIKTNNLFKYVPMFIGWNINVGENWGGMQSWK